MISISETKDEYLKALETHIEATAKILGFKIISCSVNDNYRVWCSFITEDESVVVDIEQQLKAEDNLFYKVIPHFNHTGYTRFNIDPDAWTSDGNLAFATVDVPCISHKDNKWDCKGHAIRLIKSNRIPEGIKRIVINDDTVEFTADLSEINIDWQIDILLSRYAFMHNTIHDYGMEGCNFNETIGQAKANII